MLSYYYLPYKLFSINYIYFYKIEGVCDFNIFFDRIHSICCQSINFLWGEIHNNLGF